MINQTYKNIEIIIVDDGATDSTPQICDELASKYENIKVIHQANQGLARTRGVGFKASSGEYIAFIDSDDYIDVTAYEKTIKVLEENDCDMVMFGCYLVSPDGEILMEFKWPSRIFTGSYEIFANFAKTKEPTWSMWSKVYKHRMFENIDWPKINMSEDYHLSAQLFAKAQKFAFIPEIFYYYVQQETSICHQPYNKSKREDIITAYNFVINLTQNKFPEFLPEIISRKLEYIAAILRNYFLSDYSDRREVMRQFTEIYKHDYKNMKAELKRQGRSIAPNLSISRNQQIHLWLLIHCQNFYKIYLTTRLKIHALTGI